MLACRLVKGVPYKDQMDLFIVMVLLYVFPTFNIFDFLINFIFVTATHLSKARCSHLCWKCR